MAKFTKTNNGDKGGLLVGKPHNDKNGNPIGGIKARVVETNEIIEVEGKEAVINAEASKKNWRELSKINQSVGGGVPIVPPSDTSSVKPNSNGKKNEKDLVITDDKGLVELEGGSVIINKKATEKYYKELSEINQSAGDGVEIQNPKDLEGDVDEYKKGGTTIQFNPNNVPSRWVYGYAKKIKNNYPNIWDLGGNIYGNEAFVNLERVIKRGYWLESEEWFYIKWQSFNARHKGDFLIAGVIANLKWLNKIEKGWDYMKDLIEAEIEKRGLEKNKMNTGGEVSGEKELLNLLERHYLYEHRSLGLISDKKQLENNNINWENDNSFIGKLHQYLKKYEIFGEYKVFYINDEEKIKDFQNRIKELKSSGYSVVQKISKPNKNKNKSYRFIAVKKMALGGELEMGIKAEQEHNETYKKIYNHEIPLEDAPKLNAEDHLKEMDNYYTQLAKMEGMEHGGKVAEVMREFKEGELKSSSGEKVTDIKQAIAIGLSEQRRYEAQKKLGGVVRCANCNHNWHRVDNHTTDVNVCHKCGHDNSKHLKLFEKGGYVEIEKTDKMKSDIFYNTDILKSNGDYILGGFNANDLNNIDVDGNESLLSMPKLEYIFKKRLENAIEQLKDEVRINVINRSSDKVDKYYIEEMVENELSNLLETYIDTQTVDFDTRTIANLIQEHGSYSTWIERIRTRMEEYRNKIRFSNQNINNVGNSNYIDVEEAEDDTYNATLEQMLEHLKMITEENTI